jgi:hypothetical protein
VLIAESLLSKDEVTTREMELWNKNFCEIDLSDITKSKEALLHWYYDMQASGLLPDSFDFKDILDWLGFDIGLAKD